MGNWNELTITPEIGEEIYIEGGKSAKFGMQDYIEFVHGIISNQVKGKSRCDVFIKDDYSSKSFSIEFEKDYTFTCIITKKQFVISSTSDVDFTDESFWDGFFHWDEDDCHPVTGAFYVSSFHEEDDILWLLNGVPRKNGTMSTFQADIIKHYALQSENENIIRLCESAQNDLALELLKSFYI